jgi:prepilin signal peptidase PulO-like enzyme (type II secretory pathway)
MWVWIASCVVFAGSAYLATQLAAFVYGKDAPLEDGPVPGRPPVFALVAIGALIGAIAAARGADVPSLAIVDLIVFALCAVVWTDVTRGFIGDWFVLPPLALVLVLGAIRGDIVPMAVSIALVTIPFAVAAFVSKGMGMGWGDVKLVALGAALLDVQTSILMYAVACVLAGGVAFVRRKRAEPIAFAPYLAGAIALGMLLPRAPHIV